jgi:NCS1 family nucleobase:cation symporter-1
MAVGLIIANATNTYGGGITGISMLDNVRPIKSTVRLRVVATTVVSILAVLLAVVGSSDLGTFITNFFFFLLYGLIPWSMINLVDFFLIRHGQYKTEDFFDPKGSFGARSSCMRLRSQPNFPSSTRRSSSARPSTGWAARTSPGSWAPS